METATPIETAQSRRWDGREPAVTVVVSSHGRADLLDGLLDALEAQDHSDFAVIVADNGSPDDTWSTLRSRCRATKLRLRALRLSFHDGPGVPRNTCIAEASSALIAFTDDDCLPTPGWLSALTAAFDAETVIVQGRTLPEPGGWGGPWGRTLEVTRPSGLYETANLAARRAAILDAGGFAGERLLSGRAFGEDVILGSAIARTGGFRFAADAVVHHRVMPGTYRDFLAERCRLAGFPLLLRLVPELREHTYARVFLSRRTAITDLGLAGMAIGAISLGLPAIPRIALGVAAVPCVVPWLAALLREHHMRFRQEPLRAWMTARQQVLYADLVGFGALVIGSVRARRLLL